MPEQATVWQVAGGTLDRSYDDVFLKHSVALIGPGDAGEWSPERDDGEFEGGFVRRFASEVKVGDVFLLRTGATSVRAVGIVASEYIYLEQFAEVNGWDLQHARRIRWLPFSPTQEWREAVFGPRPSRFSRAGKPEIIEFALGFLHSEPSSWREARLPPLPPPQPALAEIPREIAPLVAEVGKLSPMFGDPEKFGALPTEDELLAHLIVPFFKAFGWPTELLAVKWQNIDLTVFRDLPRVPENVHFVVEAKRLGSGIEGALGQAKSYLRGLGVQRDIIVTDGMRYRLYAADRELAALHYAHLGWLREPAKELFAAVRPPSIQRSR
jgi:hypothetical protein